MSIVDVKVVGSYVRSKARHACMHLKKLKLGVVYERMYIPDLVAKKDEKIYVIEVKSTKGALKFLKEEKLRGLLLARKYGFIPSVVSFSLKIDARDFKMEEIS